MSRIAIVGAGELGKQIWDILRLEDKADCIEFYDDYLDFGPNEKPVWGSLNEFRRDLEAGSIQWFILAIGYNHLQRKSDLLTELESFVQLSAIHPSVVQCADSMVEEGVALYAGVIIGERACVAAGTVMNHGCVIAHDSSVEKACFLGPGVVIAGNCRIGEGCYLSTGVRIGSGVHLASGWTVGAGAVVLNSFEESPSTGEFLAGIPATVRYRK